MGRISQYPLDTDIQGNDKWIGTSINNANATKNFSVDNVVEYINKSAGVESQALRYTYQNVQGDDVRLASTISFATSLGDNVPFDEITEWVISAYSKQVKDVRTYYEAPLVGNTILITNAFNPSNWAIFRWDSVTEDIDDENFYNIELTHINSTGELVANQDYLIALLDASSSGATVWGDIIGTLSDQTDLQNALNAKQDDLVSGTNIKTINGTTLLGSGDIVIEASPSGVSGAIQFSDGTAFASDAANLFYDDTNNRLGIGTNVPSARLDVKSQGALITDIAFRVRNSSDTANIFSILGNQDINMALSSSQSASFSGAGGARLLLNGITSILQSGSSLIYGGNQSYIFLNTVGNTRLSISDVGNVDIGSASAVARLSVKGSGTTSATTSLLVQNSSSVNLLTTTNDGVTTINAVDLDTQLKITNTGTGNNRSGIAFQFNNSGNDQATISARSGVLVGQIGRLFFSTRNFGMNDWMVLNEVGNLGIGELSPTARLQVKGSGSTSATTSLLVQNSSNAVLLQANDNASLGIGTTPDATAGRIRLGGNTSTSIIFTGFYGQSDITFSTGLFFNNASGQPTVFQVSGAEKIRMPSTGNLLIGTTTDIASSKLTVDSTTQGALLPRMTTTQRNAIVTPATGLIVYDTTLLSFYQYNGTAWTVVGGASASGVAGAIQFSDGSAFSSDAANLFYDNTNDRLGVGINTPTARLHTKGTGTTNATSSFRAENSNNSKSLVYNDSGQLVVNYGGATTTIDGFNIYTYNIYAPNGASRVQLDGGAMTLIDSAGQQNIVCQNNQTYIAKPLKLMSGTLTVPNAAAQLDIESTTKGFLPPRMTNAQILAIVTPPNGLMVYNTTIDHMCVYHAGAWAKLNHSPM